MTFATVKSNPYKKKRMGRTSFQLWPESFWKKLVDMGNDDDWETLNMMGMHVDGYTEEKLKEIESVNFRLYQQSN